MIGKTVLQYDTTSADTIAASDRIGAVLINADGTGITYTTVGAKKALDVNLATALAQVEINGVYNVSTNANPSNTGLVGATRNATPGVAQQANILTSGEANADAIVAANVWGLDVNSFMMAYNGTTWDRVQLTSGALNVNISSQSLNPITITGTVTANAGSGTFTVSDAALANTSLKTTQKSVTATAAAVLSSALSNRKYLYVQNADKVFLYLGDSTVTSSNGIKLSPGAIAEFRFGASNNGLYGVAPTGDTVDTRLLEAS